MLSTKRDDEARRRLLRAEAFIVPERRAGVGELVYHALWTHTFVVEPDRGS
jgi:hypothetical protein